MVVYPGKVFDPSRLEQEAKDETKGEEDGVVA